ncbi:MAG: hypothetical protein M3O15_08060 [Acidobacteriota bacterium]|nr:hypothetical protein [Acidobacteriota bacterium]
MTTRIEGNRTHLGFIEAVGDCIAPVLSAEGFACTEATPYVVRFESANVFLTVYHDRLSYELEVTLALKVDPSRNYTLRDMLDTVLGPLHEPQYFFQASDSDRVVSCLKTMSELIRKYCCDALTGKLSFYQRMEEVRQVRAETLTRSIVKAPICKAAQEAWQRHDYAKVRTLYESIEADLAPLERRRLKYAQDH